MKILALEYESEYVKSEQFTPFLKDEAKRIWELVQSGFIRETYFAADRPKAVLMLECRDVEEAREVLMSLPLAKAGLITFEVIPLVPYTGFARLFQE